MRIGRRAGIAAVGLALVATGLARATLTEDEPKPPKADEGWIELTAGDGFDPWKGPIVGWSRTTGVAIDPSDAKHFAIEPGSGPVIVNGKAGRGKDLYTKATFGDVEVHLEFNVPKGSNSGIKFQGLYEIQITDGWGIKELSASHSGGIYPRAEFLPKYRHIDDGIPPRVNASKPPGEWQTLDIAFKAPRFDASGKKVADARIVRATLNGQVVQEDEALKTPTGNAWKNPEVALGPIQLQADHGPVAFRNVRVRPIAP